MSDHLNSYDTFEKAFINAIGKDKRFSNEPAKRAFALEVYEEISDWLTIAGDRKSIVGYKDKNGKKVVGTHQKLLKDSVAAKHAIKKLNDTIIRSRVEFKTITPLSDALGTTLVNSYDVDGLEKKLGNSEQIKGAIKVIKEALIAQSSDSNDKLNVDIRDLTTTELVAPYTLKDVENALAGYCKKLESIEIEKAKRGPNNTIELLVAKMLAEKYQYYLGYPPGLSGDGKVERNGEVQYNDTPYDRICNLCNEYWHIDISYRTKKDAKEWLTNQNK